MAVNTLSEALDNLYTSTWQNMKEDAKDNIFSAMPFWYWMKEKGKLKPVTGGRFITEPLAYDDNENVVWLGKGGTTSLNDYEFLTVAKYDWKYLAVPIVRFGVDDQQNSGKNQIMSLMNAKLDNSKNSFINQLETRLCGSGAADAKYMLGLQDLVPADPTASTTICGGINPSTYTWWRNQTSTMSGLSFATYGVSKMRTILNDCSNNLGQDTPDIILTDQTSYEYYEDAVLDHYRVTSSKMADAGFTNQTFKGIPMVWAPSISQKMYFLNTRYLYMNYDPRLNMDMTSWKEIPNQVNDRVAQIMLACEFTVSRRKCQGVIHTINTA